MKPGYLDEPERSAVAACRERTRRLARSFHAGMRLTPEPGFSALCVVYVWMHAADEIADGPPPLDGDRVAEAERFWSRTTRILDGGEAAHPASAATPAPGPPLWPALAWLARGFALPRDALRGVIDGQLADLSFTQPPSEAALDAYCRRVASTVGRVCVAVWGGDPAATGHLADARGVALQRTNVLRDVAEDAARGRVYLPADALARHGLVPADLAAPPPDDATGDRLRRLLAEQVDLARAWYDRSAALEVRLPRRGRASSGAIGGVYRALLEEIARDPLAVLSRRVRPTRPKRLAAVARAWAMSRLPAPILLRLASRP
ncbi:phytoene/squalene synthase family protein [Phycisphaera mikurensis]|uniref:Phytoene synthase n=1 Tax=Phycisphaera mikurensis (strain NBRC 102666 / KCTC 22515 / FYK2301M01) TaxID=1142394 RepID=I0IFU8_PHYMF|nr:phytoene/squalene synthase family protein [Phycisphaera mikurensis]MBB6440475.1 phytoene synthase [Phycisphaera mikurensis]BAM04136.1 phytoene synthase [Phycisphaera mikurensis NBRC 102666]